MRFSRKMYKLSSLDQQKLDKGAYFKLALIAGLLVLQNACMLGPDYKPPAIHIPENWVSAQDQLIGQTEQSIEQDWWQHFHDPLLNQLITKAADNNLDIQSAGQRIAAARAAKSIASAALLPSGDMAFSATRQANQIGFPSGVPAGFSNTIKQPFNIFKTGFDASWELDLFGGHKRDTESAQAELEAAELSRNDLLVSTLAEVAKSYIDIRHYQAQLLNAQAIVDADQKQLSISQERFSQGESAGIEVSKVMAQQENDAAQLAYFSNLVAQAEYSLDLLFGENPGAVHQLLSVTAAIPVSDRQLILAAPAMVIANRPDIRIAERKLAAATAQQGVAVAKFFPDVSLTGFIGLFNTNAGNLINISSKSWSMGGSVLWPILSYGTLSANLDSADAKQQQAMTAYQHSILSALADVERSFTAYNKQEQFRLSQEKAAATDQHIIDIANERYQAGSTSFLEVLDAQKAWYAARTRLLTAQAETAQNLVALYKSLGGGWQADSAVEKQGSADFLPR